MAEVTENTTHTYTKMHGIDNGARTLGIIGTALAGLGILGGGAKLLGGLNLGGNAGPACNCTAPIPTSPQEMYIERKQCENYLDLTKQYYEDRIANMTALNEVNEAAYLRDQENSFRLYKYGRDSHDELSSKIEDVNKKVDIMLAVRPYQDALIDAKINNTAEVADFNLWKRTCKMIQGQLVLPSTPVVSGYGSYSSCNCNTSSSSNAGA